MSNLILNIGSGSISISVALLNYLRDIYCVGKTVFSFYKKPGKRVKRHEVADLLIHLRDIYCVGKTAFSLQYAGGRKAKKSGIFQKAWNAITKWLAKKTAFLSATKTVLGRVRVFHGFYRLSRINQGIIVGCLIVIATAGTFPAWLIYMQNHLSKTGIQQADIRPYDAPENSIEGKPVGLSIPSLHIYLPVIEGHYDSSTKDWTLTNDNAQYMAGSAKPNNVGGKTFIYGHALNNIFGKLPYIQPGAELSLTTSNGYRFHYRYQSSFNTSPSDLSVLDNTKKPVLFVQTCSGVFYQYREIFSFQYVGYEKV